MRSSMIYQVMWLRINPFSTNKSFRLSFIDHEKKFLWIYCETSNVDTVKESEFNARGFEFERIKVG